MRPTLAILDCSGIVHAAKHSTKTLSFRGIPTGIIYNFLQRVLTIGARYKPCVVIFAWDTPRAYSLRKEVYPEYKSNRDKQVLSEEDALLNEITAPQFDQLENETLIRIGFRNLFSQMGYEADDVIASICRCYREHPKVVVSTDKDMYQLIDNKTKILNFVTNKEIGIEEFTDMYGLNPVFWAMAKAIGGCNSDNVEGIEGFGDPAHSEQSRALKFLRGELPDGKFKERVTSPESKLKIEDNLALVELPLVGTDPVEVDFYEDFTVKAYADVVAEMNMKSLLKTKNLKAWEEVFCQ